MIFINKCKLTILMLSQTLQKSGKFNAFKLPGIQYHYNNMFQKAKKFLKKYSLDVVLISVYNIILIFSLVAGVLNSIPLFLLVSSWLPIYYAWGYQDLLKKDCFRINASSVTVREFIETFFFFSFALPFIGPVIAVIRINYLRSKLEKKNYKKSP